MKTVGIVGITDWRIGDRMWRNLEEACRQAFPIGEFAVEHTWYLPWEKAKILSYADHIIEKHDTGEDVLFLAHSFGGVIACAIASRFTKSRVLGVVTINSPHKIQRFYNYFTATPQPLTVPTITFASIFDPVVPFFLTKYPGSTHFFLYSEHFYMFVWTKFLSKIVAEKIQKTLFLKEKEEWISLKGIL